VKTPQERELPGKRRSGPEAVDVAVGARIRLRRRMLGMSQSHLAEGLGITFQQVQKYERGANRVSASMLVKIAAALDTTVAALIGEDGAEPLDPHVYAQLAVTGSTELLKVYAEINSAELRRALVLIAIAVGAAARARAEKKA
jgi:transcriptional regulator with XRE-family HTH domain